MGCAHSAHNLNEERNFCAQGIGWLGSLEVGACTCLYFIVGCLHCINCHTCSVAAAALRSRGTTHGSMPHDNSESRLSYFQDAPATSL